ncbi:MAG TPA: hypothetical protein VKZ86_02040 [Cyclobacteriaceae bacterium]|nr:hypothetical protein [Cyclobacteriaceae bacterium]
MRIQISITACLLMALAAISCSNDNDSRPEGAMWSTIAEKDVIVMEPGTNYKREGFVLRVDTIMNDSRCPENLLCVWAGNVEVRFYLQFIAPNKGSEVTFTLNANSSLERDTVIQGVRFALIDVSPYPKKDTPIPYEDYRVTVSVGE